MTGERDEAVKLESASSAAGFHVQPAAVPKPFGRPFQRKYTITPAILEEIRLAYIGGRTEVTAKLGKLSARTGIPAHMLKSTANRNGWYCCPLRRAWTSEEDALLRDKAGSVSVFSIARRLHRSQDSVAYRMWALGLSTRISTGYTLTDLVDVFGVSKDRVNRWVQRGLLGKGHHHGNAIRFTDENVLRFIRNNPHQYSLARVDQMWFAGMVFGQGADGAEITRRGLKSGY